MAAGQGKGLSWCLGQGTGTSPPSGGETHSPTGEAWFPQRTTQEAKQMRVLPQKLSWAHAHTLYTLLFLKILISTIPKSALSCGSWVRPPRDPWIRSIFFFSYWVGEILPQWKELHSLVSLAALVSKETERASSSLTMLARPAMRFNLRHNCTFHLNFHLERNSVWRPAVCPANKDKCWDL